MRRLLGIAAFALLLAVPVWAQRGGGGHGSFAGGHAGFGGGHGGGFSGHGFGGARGGFGGAMHGGFSHGLHSPSRTGLSRSPFLHNGFRNRFHGRFFDRDHDDDRFFLRSNCFGWRCRGGWGFPGWGWGWGYPWLWDWWDNDSSYNDDYYNNLAIANEMNQQSLEQQRMLRQEEADSDQDTYAAPRSDRRPAPRASSPAPADPIVPPTVLVFRDQHKEEIQNYAIVGQTLWNFAPQHTQKIALAQLDLAATTKANDDRGITFRVPVANAVQ